MSAPPKESTLLTYQCPSCKKDQTVEVGAEKMKAIQEFYRLAENSTTASRAPVLVDKHPVELQLYGEPVQAFHLVKLAVDKDLTLSVIQGKEALGSNLESCRARYIR